LLQALQQQNDHTEAIADYRRVLALEPSNAAAQQQIANCMQKMAELRKVEKAKFAGMFDRANARGRKVSALGRKEGIGIAAGDGDERERAEEGVPGLAVRRGSRGRDGVRVSS
jgi:hypothetical protein